MNDLVSRSRTQQKSRQKQRPQLGRGLEALFDEDRSGIQFLSVDALEPGAFQPRQEMDAELLQELASSIQEHGVLQPILVRPHPHITGQYQIIAGERRWRAAVIAQCQTVPVYMRDLSETEAKVAALIENLQRADLNPIEEAEGLYCLLEEHHLSQEELARTVGKSRPHVANMLRLLRLPFELQTQLKKGVISAGHARALLTHPDPLSAMTEVIAKALSVRQTELLVQKALRQTKKNSKNTNHILSPSEITALEGGLYHQLGLKVAIKCNSKKGGVLKIHYKNLDQFNAILTLLKK
ncbi:MAG: ParB/RepB/Spo0J family partition protein [Acetobacter sp.]|nr:ParB/RepB/Spo0J family partition protein [Acetobacter sp.]MBQ5773845.1 ParB/RepB/Spo0J family partition protein [Acetobacter sp.]